jgi:hypothetical protein
MKIFLLNGPPSCGKDTMANVIVRNDPSFTKGSFAYPIKQANKQLFNLSDEQYASIDGIYKDKKMAIFGGKSWRQVNIDFTEKYLKKEYGKGIAGKLFIDRLRNIRFNANIQNIVVSDTGFYEELEEVCAVFDPKEVYVIRIARKNKTFTGDSRSYFPLKDLKVNEYFIQNNAIQEEYAKNCLLLMDCIRNGKKPAGTVFSDFLSKKGK